jgi:molybdenum-dependent DNA-binding transcriptional regulator ModE
MAAEPREADEIITAADGALDLPPKQELALRAVVSHPTLKEAARAAGISETTLWRYMQSETFSRRVREARREAINHTFARLQAASGDAVSVLQELMTKEDAPASARITAARTVLDYAVRVVEIEDLRSRVEELEEFIRIRQDQEGAQEDEEVEG